MMMKAVVVAVFVDGDGYKNFVPLKLHRDLIDMKFCRLHNYVLKWLRLEFDGAVFFNAEKRK